MHESDSGTRHGAVVTQPRVPGSGARRTVIIVVAGVLGVMVSCLAALIIHMHSEFELESYFRQLARERVECIERELHSGIIVVESVAAHVSASPTMDAEQFRAFTVPLLARYASIQAIGYDQRVTAEQRSAFEAELQREGFREYRITEGSPDGVRIARSRPDHVAVRYIEPVAGNELALGLDIGAEPVRREALERALRTGTAAMTGPVRLVQEHEEQAGVLICVPVNRLVDGEAHVTGFAVGVLRVGAMIDKALAPLGRADVHVRVTDATAPPAFRPLHVHGPEAAATAESSEPSPTSAPGLEERATVHAAGRSWTITCTPTAAFMTGGHSHSPWTALVIGLLVTILVMLSFVRLTRLETRLHHAVSERARSETAYRDLVRNAPVCIHELDRDGRLTEMNPAGLRMVGAAECASIRGQRYLDCVAEADRARVQAVIDDAMVGTASEFQFSGAGVIEGQEFASILVPAFGDAGCVDRLIGISQNITRQQRALESLRIKTDQLELLNAIATGVNAGMATDDVITMIVERVSEFFPDLRVTYATIDASGVLEALRSRSPAGMPDIEGLSCDLTSASEYLDTLRRDRMVVVPNIDESSFMDPLAEAMVAGGTRAIIDIPLHHSSELLGVLCFDAPTPHEWTDHEISTLREVAQHLSVLLKDARTEAERLRAVEALRVSEARQAVILRAAPIVLYLWRPIEPKGCTWISDQVDGLTGFAPQQFYEREEFWRSRIHPDDLADAELAMHRVLEEGQGDIEYRWQHADGTYRWFRDHPVAVRNDDGETVEIIGTWMDITERKRTERRQLLMMRELDHRLKNNLAAVLALARQSLAKSSSLEAFGQSYTGRVLALARTHEALASASWDGVELARIAQLTLSPYCRDAAHRVCVRGASVMLPARASTPVCMALHELATNAAKYGALSSAGGRVDIAWSVDGAGDLHLVWTERDGPPVDTTPTPGYGISLINGLIAHELQGHVDLRFEKAGAVCEIMIPSPSLQAERAPVDADDATPSMDAIPMM